MKLSSFLLSLVPAALVACHHDAAPPVHSQVAAAPTTQASSTSSFDDCVAMFTRSRTCSSDYIPALVATRVRVDIPAGIAAEDQANGRDALVAQANAEWATDSTDANIEANCRQVVDRIGADEANRMHPVAQGCLAKASCAEFVSCEMPLFEAHMGDRR